jgi:hypothetical protein
VVIETGKKIVTSIVGAVDEIVIYDVNQVRSFFSREPVGSLRDFFPKQGVTLYQRQKQN